MTCPACDRDGVDAPTVEGIKVCQGCARTFLLLEDGSTRLATADDMRGLAASSISALRQARPTAWRNDVRARHARIVGGR